MQEQDLIKQEQRNEEQIPTYMTVSINFEPFIQISLANEKAFYPGHESAPFLQSGSEWVQKITDKYESNPRVVKVFLENLKG
mmetsp:Transcript_37280/g.57190  ORF Transcript_37280/g.57190 Transcript_37280/m.57190 type:complete len:82 (+) Transcript_37280:2942-3187(+)